MCSAVVFQTTVYVCVLSTCFRPQCVYAFCRRASDGTVCVFQAVLWRRAELASGSGRGQPGGGVWQGNLPTDRQDRQRELLHTYWFVPRCTTWHT